MNITQVLATGLFCATSLSLGPKAVLAERASAEITLPPTDNKVVGLKRGEVPICGPGGDITADAIINGLSNVADSLIIGVPILSSLASTSSEYRDWAAARLGLHKGNAVCATMCVIVPSSGVEGQVCWIHSHTGQRTCDPYRKNGIDVINNDIGWASADKQTTAPIGPGKQLYCEQVRNWHTSESRWFGLVVDY